MTSSSLPPAVEYCLIHCGITIQDSEYGWITACESKGLGYVYLMESQFHAPQPGSSADIVLPAIALRERLAQAISQGSVIYLG